MPSLTYLKYDITHAIIPTYGIIVWNNFTQFTEDVTLQMPGCSPPAAARVFLCCGHGSRRLPCPQHKTPCEPPKVVRSPEQLPFVYVLPHGNDYISMDKALKFLTGIWARKADTT